MWIFAAELDKIPNDVLSTLTQLVWQYGPFAFSVLFIYSVSRWSYSKYRDAVDRKLPSSDIAIHRRVFVGACIAALSLVVVSVWYWFEYRPTVYLFSGEIDNLKDYERISSTDLYRLQILHGKTAAKAPEQRNEQFIVMRSLPFKSSDSFSIDFSKGDDTVEPLYLRYTTDENPKFVIEFDESAKANVLHRLSVASGTRSNDSGGRSKVRALVETVFAAAFEPQPQSKAMQAPAKIADTAAIQVLQNTRSSVGAKINALGSLRQTGIAPAVLVAPSENEPFAVTLIDLARHSDRQLAYFARAALAECRLNELLKTWLVSSNSSERASAETILLRMDTQESIPIAQSLPPAGGARILDELKKPNRVKNLRPTGSSQGDRYYVQATWNAADANVSSCLTKLFNTSLINDRTMGQEASMMAGRGQRLVYWYDKTWAIGIADQIAGCGAKADFVTPKFSAA